ncbi:MAG: metallophosphoesterase family protein [Candidatus Diapherotrites archaeon]|uniref:Metallophosphoesterase family protein n=1 Tax=Candidatus Iainarchaeum sp. TaxID=3101447 RepID=A0A938YWS8_9ARCH|nr:metallophosphoesterase family protein [Candidatus Diapherotrites archaeon]
MQSLVLSDIHFRMEKIEKAKELIHNRGLELALLLGDLTQMGGAGEAKQVIEALKPTKILGIPGNFETRGVLEELERQGLSLHARKEKVGRFTLIGFGGGLWNDPGQFLFPEEEIKKSLGMLFKGEQNTILLTHLPAFGTKMALAHNGKDIGSKAVREAIERFQPKMHLCGHCHEGIGEEKVGKTLSINVGAVKDGNAMLLELNGELKWERIKL